jgi:DNA-binding response OmpR family regulator
MVGINQGCDDMRDKARILIIEDNTPVAMMMVHVLSRAGCDVLVANTGEKGMELARENKFDLIALDVDLPDISGFEICSELNQRHLTRHIPIIFVSKQSSEKERQRGLELGAVDYITKPFKTEDFTSHLLSQIRENSMT